MGIRESFRLQFFWGGFRFKKILKITEFWVNYHTNIPEVFSKSWEDSTFRDNLRKPKTHTMDPWDW